jgi:hypothetical protein
LSFGQTNSFEGIRICVVAGPEIKKGVGTNRKKRISRGGFKVERRAAGVSLLSSRFKFARSRASFGPYKLSAMARSARTFGSGVGTVIVAPVQSHSDYYWERKQQSPGDSIVGVIVI